MVIPLADNINHADESVSYKARPDSYLSKFIPGSTRICYGDFTGESAHSGQDM